MLEKNAWIYGYLTQSFHSTKDVRCVSNLGVLILSYAKGGWVDLSV
jgi:hypothetical protein